MSPTLRALAASVALVFATHAPVLDAQQIDRARGTAAFLGRIVNGIDSTPVRSADIRLIFIDSLRQLRGQTGGDSLQIYADSDRMRVGVTDAKGDFAIRRLAAGRYLFHVRRIGYEALEGALVVDTGVVSTTIALQVVSQTLAKVLVTETAVDKVKEKLDRNGFLDRSHSGLAATFLQGADIQRTRPQTVADILNRYGIHDGKIMLDRMPFDYESVADYPAELVIGVEIYRHGRPTEFNMTRRGPGALSRGGQSAASEPLVLIWTYVF
jgi:hypothetical protein